MKRYPYWLEKWYEEDAIRNPDGTFVEGMHEWRMVGRCNARQNGQADQVRGANGDVFLYSYEVTMPPDIEPIPLGTQVRVIDRDGINIFDHQPKSDAEPKKDNSDTYPVQGFYKSGQRHEDSRLWL